MWSGLGILAAGLVVGVVWRQSRPQTFTLANGTKLTLLAVTYGKVQHFPATKTTNGRRHAFPDSTNYTLVVYIEQHHTNNIWPNYQLWAYDEAATACAGPSAMNQRRIRQGEEIVAFRFDAFPRRCTKFDLRLMEGNPRNGGQTATNAFVVSNPARGPFPSWYADPLPNHQSDGDLDVTLTRLTFGAAATPFNTRNQNPAGPGNRGAQMAFRIQQDGKAAADWQPIQVETFDATGNHVTTGCSSHWDNGEEVALFQPGLWPDEPVWKVRVEFSRTSGFSDDELWSVPNVPLQPGNAQEAWLYPIRNRNAVFVETTLNGVHLQLFPVMQSTNQPNMRGPMEGLLVLRAGSPLAGARLNLLKLTDERGHEIRAMNWGAGGSDYRYLLQGLGSAKSLNLTLALHRSRFVEFMAKPAPL